MKYYIIILFCLISIFSLSAHAADCGFIGKLAGICELAEELNKSAEELSKAVDQVAEAVPGERYLRMIDAINHPATPEAEKKRYQTLARNLFGVSPATGYQINVGFGLKNNINIEAAFFYAKSGLPSDVKSWCNTQVTYQPAQVSNTLNRPMTPQKRSDFINSQLMAAISVLGSDVGNIQHKSRHAVMIGEIKTTQFTLTQASALDTYRGTGLGTTNNLEASGHLSKDIIENGARRRLAKDYLRRAMDAYYGEPGKVVNGNGFIRDYQPYVDNPYLVVTIADGHFNELSDEFLVKAIVYAKDENGNVTQKALDNMWPIRLTKKQFLANKEIPCGNPTESIRWAVAPLLRDTILNAKLVKSIIETKELLKRYKIEARK